MVNQRGLMKLFNGESSSVTLVTSGYTQVAEVPGVARNLVFEIYITSTAATAVDARLVQGMARLDAKTSDINYKFPATTLTQKTSNFSFNTTKGAYMFALQAKISTASTDATATSVKAKWIGIG